MDRYQNVCVWFMARDCRLPKVGTHACQSGNHRLPLQGTAGSHRLAVMVPNLGTRGYHCKQLPVPEVGTHAPQPGNHRLPWQGTADLEKPGNQRLPLQGIAGSQRLEIIFSKLSNYHCKELPVATAWNSLFQTWKSIRYQWKDLLIAKTKNSWFLIIVLFCLLSRSQNILFCLLDR